MKTLNKMALGLSAAALLWANGLYSQVRTVAVTNIPFDFTVQSKTLPAGEYALERDSQSSDLLRIQSVTTRHAAYILALRSMSKHKAGNKETGKVFFHRYGDRYFFSEIWTPDGGPCGGVMPSRLERELQANGNETRMALVSVPLAGAAQ